MISFAAAAELKINRQNHGAAAASVLASRKASIPGLMTAALDRGRSDTYGDGLQCIRITESEVKDRVATVTSIGPECVTQSTSLHHEFEQIMRDLAEDRDVNRDSPNRRRNGTEACAGPTSVEQAAVYKMDQIADQPGRRGSGSRERSADLHDQRSPRTLELSDGKNQAQLGKAKYDVALVLQC
jgi:hypothetical protein